MDVEKSFTDACHRNVQESKFFLTAIAAILVFSKEFYGYSWSQLQHDPDLKFAFGVILTSGLAFSTALTLSFTLERARFALMAPNVYGKYPKINEWLVGSKPISMTINLCLLFGIPLFLVGFFLLFISTGSSEVVTS